MEKTNDPTVHHTHVWCRAATRTVIETSRAV